MEMLQLKLSASVHGLCFIASDQSVHAITWTRARLINKG